MGYLNRKENKEDFDLIRRTLARRKLKMSKPSEWEIHGPHSPDLPHVVYVGEVRDADGYEYCVAIYPQGFGWTVYEVDDPDSWWKTDKENRFPVFDKET